MSSAVHARVQHWSRPLASYVCPGSCGTGLLARVVSAAKQFSNLVQGWRLAAFLGGLFSVWLAIGSPLVALDHQLLTFHMVKLLLLMAVGAPLILWGMPVLPLLCGLPKGLKVEVLLESRPAKWARSWHGHSALCWLVGATAVIGWHVPAVFQLALGSHWWHNVEHASFLLAGVLFWWPVVQPWPRVASWHGWAGPFYLFLATLPCDILSSFLAFCGRVIYPSYLAAPRLFHMSPLQDQECAGAVVWVSVTFIYLIPAVVITMQMLPPVFRDHKPQGKDLPHRR